MSGMHEMRDVEGGGESEMGSNAVAPRAFLGLAYATSSPENPAVTKISSSDCDEGEKC
jgi:hypothetical protein